MKRLVVIAFMLLLSFSLVACGNNQDNLNTGEPENFEMIITINGSEFAAVIYENETAKAFLNMLPLTANMSAMAHEKYYNLPNDLPVAAINPETINEGDIMLWGSNCLVLFYETFSTQYSYTKIGRIENTEGLAAAVGSGSVTITFSK